MIGVVGAGAFGTALAVTWARAGSDVVLWGRNTEAMAAAQSLRALPCLPGVTLPDKIHATADPGHLDDCATLVLAVPTQFLPDVLTTLPAFSASHIVAACKGVDLRSLQGPTTTIAQAYPQAVTAILSGPSFATDIAAGLPTALSLGCENDAVGASLQAALSTPTIRLYRTQDVTGVELGGALKNVIAIACGAAIGAGLGDSARAALMTRGMAEIMRLAAAMGARRDTLMGLSGLGDLALTCASPASRNFALGMALGRGEPLPDATTEGVATADAALRLATERDLDLPVTQAVSGLVAGRLTVKDAMTDLLTRDLKTE
ncbi:NAD(P)H-dependent glycerol-3-phosphate dehydrogenase [Jannaschia pohangensis]|uniref:Glycerol-3-phosphate dehydrogenase [NAD(P)+] n=1 Tax=Jannaschia pohangensis TaxID=390807 RepID=A0A1I3PYQ1_9RHOB|nr:NAD(P)H-dependent glycerol-3-phosphate dehydrogenase [Jannaschia pohangensis]SFJ26798.1 glycerol-3-phosphate dehydrogenase (NAD(P)+) [Jannaschia pohangensis]